MAETKKYAVREFLNTISVTPRDKWVVEKMLHRETEKKSLKEWDKVMKGKCAGINYKKIN